MDDEMSKAVVWIVLVSGSIVGGTFLIKKGLEAWDLKMMTAAAAVKQQTAQ